MQAKFLNPFTDFGFKKIFGEEASKPALIDFLNTLLPEQDQVKSITYKNNEQQGQTEFDRKAIFDIYCESHRGEKFVVELQKAKQNYFKDRSIFYSTFPIQEQAEKGEWNYQLKAVYCIGILDFEFDKPDSAEFFNQVVSTVKLKNQKNEVFYDKFTLIYLEMPRFKKSLDELSSRQDLWFYFLKHLEDLTEIPSIFKDSIFDNVFETASMAKLDDAEKHTYQASLKTYRDLKNVIDTAFEEGLWEGRLEGRLEGEAIGIQKGEAIGIQKERARAEQEKRDAILKALDAGLDLPLICQMFQVSLEQVQEMQRLPKSQLK
jgi:predicted transposase/invertase (TIGR01784 family)